MSQKTLKKIWMTEFVSNNKCCLCFNSGLLIDLYDRKRPCICPNGRGFLKKSEYFTKLYNEIK